MPVGEKVTLPHIKPLFVVPSTGIRTLATLLSQFQRILQNHVINANKNTLQLKATIIIR